MSAADAGSAPAPEPESEPDADDEAAAASASGAGEFDDDPTPLSSRLSLAAGAVAVGGATLANPVGGALAVVGLAGIAGGVSYGSVTAVGLGSVGLFLGLVPGGIAGAAPLVLVLSAVAAALAWDLGEQAVTLGEQVGHDADTRRGELAHAAGSLLVGVASATVVLAVYSVVGGGFPAPALVVLLVAAAVLAAGLRP